MKRSKHTFSVETVLLYHEHKQITTRDCVGTSWDLGRSVPPFCKQTHPSLEVLPSPKGDDIRKSQGKLTLLYPRAMVCYALLWFGFKVFFERPVCSAFYPPSTRPPAHFHRATLMNKSGACVSFVLSTGVIAGPGPCNLFSSICF